MDKILDLGDVFDLGVYNFNPLLLIPVVVAVIAVVAVFVFGFKKTENPPFRKIVGSANSSNALTKRKKRSAQLLTEAVTGAPHTTIKEPKLVTPVQLVNQRNNKIDAVESKANNIAAKKSNTTKGTIAAALKSVKTKNTEKNEAKARALEQANDGEGEWKTVITKKKKQPDTATAEKSPAPGTQTKNKNATAEAQAKKKDTSSKKVKKQEQPEEVPTVNTVAAEVKSEESRIVPSVAKAALTESESTPVNAQAINLAFDELEDAAWTETKPQKKNKKRALRE